VEGYTLTEAEPDRFTLAPWPFEVPEVRVHCEGRLLTPRSETEADLHAALESAALVPLTFTLRRRSG
jgi:hypothetical protein